MQGHGILVGAAQHIQQKHLVTVFLYCTLQHLILIDVVGSGFTLASSKGACAVTSGKLTCASGTTATIFTVCFTSSCPSKESSANTSQAVGGKLAYNGATTFFAAAAPSGSTQQTIYTTSKATSVTFQWQGV